MTRIDEIKSTGLKATIQRQRILEVFQTTRVRHLTAEGVHRELVKEGADISLATVYRALLQFEQSGLLSRGNFDSGKAVYELNEGEHHDHLVCLDCGKVEEFYNPEIEKIQQTVATERGFSLQQHALSLYARCDKPNCEHRAER